MGKNVALGVSLNNPLNIEYNSRDAWQGLNDPPQSGRFFWFKTPAYGIRAGIRALISAQDKHGCRTVRQHITRWAPPIVNGIVENPTEQYILNVCAWTGFGPDQPIDMQDYSDCKAMVTAVIRQEQGQVPYGDAVIDEALKLAGIAPEAQASTMAAVMKDPKAVLGTIAGTAATASAAVSSISDFWDTLASHVDPRILVWTLAASVIGFAIYLVASRISRHRQGLT